MSAFPDILFGEQKPTTQQLEMCRYHACAVVDDLGWTPPRAEARIRQQVAREMNSVVRKAHAVEISDGRGTIRLTANPLGMAGASQVATVAMSR